jgi:hypothetical protein
MLEFVFLMFCIIVTIGGELLYSMILRQIKLIGTFATAGASYDPENVAC